MFIINEHNSITTLFLPHWTSNLGVPWGVLQTRGKTDSIETWTNKLPVHQPSSSTPSTIPTDQIHRCQLLYRRNTLLWSVGIVEGVVDEG